MSGARFLGHRGAMARYPENTLLSLESALRAEPPADGVEFDVRLSADRCPVIFHDGDTERLTGAPGTIESRDLEEIRRLRVRGEAIPTLEEVIDALAELSGAQGRTLVVNVELKPTGSPEPLIDACTEHLNRLEEHPRLQLVVSSFDPLVLKAACDSQVSWRLALIYEDPSALRFVPHLEEGRALDLHPRCDLVTPEHMHELGDRTVRTWTVDQIDVARTCMDLGVAAIISNDPAALMTALFTETDDDSP